MAKVYFGPYRAVKYTGKKHKELSTSMARPKPVLKRGDIVILEKRSAFNKVNKGFEEFEYVDEIEFVKADKEAANMITELERRNDELASENAALSEMVESLTRQLETSEDVGGDEALTPPADPSEAASTEGQEPAEDTDTEPEACAEGKSSPDAGE